MDPIFTFTHSVPKSFTCRSLRITSPIFHSSFKRMCPRAHGVLPHCHLLLRGKERDGVQPFPQACSAPSVSTLPVLHLSPQRSEPVPARDFPCRETSVNFLWASLLISQYLLRIFYNFLLPMGKEETLLVLPAFRDFYGFPVLPFSSYPPAIFV